MSTEEPVGSRRARPSSRRRMVPVSQADQGWLRSPGEAPQLPGLVSPGQAANKALDNLLGEDVLRWGGTASRPVSEVFSTDWSFGAGQDECCFGDGADPLRAQSDAVERLPAGLEQRDAAFALGA